MSFMTTYLGHKFFVNQPTKTRFALADIAHALSNLCRFGGHTRQFYSVAQHSVLVSEIVAGLPDSTPDLELWGLMHDSTEAYMIDIPTPLKVTLEGYSERENKLMKLISDSFELPDHGEAGILPKMVKDADRIALVTEARQLMYGGVSEWKESFKRIKPYAEKIVPLPPEEAEKLFLARWREIQERRRKRS